MTSPTKILNEDTLSGLIESIGSVPASGILEVFLNELGVLATDISSHMNIRAFDLIAEVAHTVKSTSATFGADRLNVIAVQMERAANAEDHVLLATLLQDFNFCIEKTTLLFQMYTE